MSEPAKTFKITLTELSDGFSYALKAPDGGSCGPQSFQLPEKLSQDWQSLSPSLYRSLLRETKSTTRDKRLKDAKRHLEDLGKQLYDAIFSHRDAHALLERGKNALAEDELLLLQLSIQGSRLEDLPWEALYYEGRFLALDRQLIPLRHLEHSEPIKAIRSFEPLRVLFVSADPYQNLDLDSEFERLEEALDKLYPKVELDELPHASFQDLADKLSQDGPYHVLHIAGHAEKTKGGQLLLERDVVSAADLATQLSQHPSLALVVLNACESALADEKLNPFAGLAKSIARQRKYPSRHRHAAKDR
ncbi:MAG: CHAT domain-containing protein [Deinococcales bacterium]